jgi:hypothetical protein
MTKLHASKFIREKQLLKIGFKQTDFKCAEKFIALTDRLPKQGWESRTALHALTNKLINCKKALTLNCESKEQTALEWQAYINAHRKLNSCIQLVETYIA